MSPPLVSILVPTYNGERFLRETLRSALNQTHRNIEVLVGDDCSTDSTPDLLAEIAATDPRVRVIQNARNVGVRQNATTLLENARGDFIKYLLHDDLLAPSCVHVLLKGMRSPSVSLAFSHRALIDEHGARVEGHAFDKPAQVAGPLDGRKVGNTVLETLSNFIGETTTCLFRRADVDIESLWVIDGRQLHALDDLSLWLRLLSKGDAYYDPRTLSFFRSHPGQRSNLTRLNAGAASDWPRLFDWARRHGYLTDAAQERRAYANAMVNAAMVHARLQATEHGPLALEGVFLSMAHALETDPRITVDRSLPLQERSRRAALLSRFAQELDVWAGTYRGALAAPAADPVEVAATVEAFREIRAAGVAARFVLAVDTSLVAEMTGLAEAAIAAGTDVDVELVAVDDVAAILTEEWLAVAPRGSRWHGGRAGAVWSFDGPPDR